MKKLLLITIALMIGAYSFAQVLMSEYSFTYTAGTYTEITGGTLLGNESIDDQRFVDPAVPLGGTTTTGVGFPIGFDFTYGGVVFDRVAINANGWISLGHSSLTPSVNNASTSGYTPIGSTTAITPAYLVNRIAPFGRDLQAQTGATLRIETVGTAPNQELVIQWKNYRKWNATGDSFNFQIRLQQNGNKVVFVYGSFTNNTTATTAQVGLRGEPATTATNWKNLSSTTSWTAPAAGGTNSATMTNSTTVFPPSGTTYTWAPPVVGAPPNPANIVSPANGAVNVSLTPTLSWASGGGSPTGYDVYFNGSLVSPNQTGTTYVPGTLSYSTAYTWQIIPKNANGDATDCPVWGFTTMADPTITAFPYVQNFDSVTAPALPIGWMAIDNNGDGDAWITYATTPRSAPNAAMIYTDYNTANDDYLVTPPVVLTGNQRMKFWTKAQSTSEVDEVAVLLSSTTPTAAAFTIVALPSFPVNFTTYAEYTVDLSAYSGTHYIAFARKEAPADGWRLYIDDVTIENIPVSPILTLSPTSWDFGQTVINTAPTKQFSITNTGAGTLEIGSIGISGDYFSLTTNPAPASLTTGQSATFTVQYAPTAVGTHEGTVTINDNRAVTTVDLDGVCVDPSIYYANLPYTQNFDSVTTPALPFGWSKVGTTGSVYTQSTSSYSAPNCMYIYTPAATLALPPVNMATETVLRMKFWARANYTAGDALIVGYLTNPSDASTFTPIQSFTMAGLTYAQYQVTLGAVTGIKYYAIQAGTLYYSMLIDDVVIEEVPPVPVFSYNPASINFGNVLQNVAAPAQNVTITNTGGGTLNIGAADISITGPQSAMFSYVATNLPAALAAGQSVVIPVSVTVTQQGPVSATLTIANSQSRTNYDVALSATGLPAGTMVYMLGNIPTAYNTAPTTASRSDQPGVLNFTVPAGRRITGVDTAYSMLAQNVAYMSEQRSFLVCATNNQTEPAVYSGVGSSGGTYAYNRTGLTLANNLTGDVSFELHAFRTWGNATGYEGTNDYYNYIVNGTWMLIVYTDVIPVGGPAAPILTYPADEATNLPRTGFNLQWQVNPAGSDPTRYMVYLAGDPTDILESEFQWETVNTTFNPITEGAFEYYYDDVWYWTVKAINVHGEAAATPIWFEIQSDPAVTTFPWNENFDAALTVPSGWTTADVDGAGTNWVGSATYSHSAPNSFKHGFSTSPTTGQNGWLISPPVTVPAGNYYLSWWNYNVYPTWMVYNGVKVNTTNNPADPNWVELWSNSTPATAWSQAVVSISAYAGQTVHFAFNYQGYDGDDWYIDDVSVYELLVDTFGPTITHLPLINTPREDIGQYVVAGIVDDATWNNPIGGANMYYSINGGTTWSAPVAMTLDVAPTYYALIPAQALGTTVTYKIEAWDSLNNTTVTNNFAYGVNDPTWIWYDQGGTTYLGYTTTAFGPTVLFDNPFYGTGNAMQLLATDGSSYYGNAANLQIQTYDGTNLVPYFATPIPVTFGVQTYETFDLSTYNVQITTPYFLVSYLDVPMGNYILFDGTYNYGTSYVYQGATLYTMSNPGSWAIGAFVQTGASQALNAPVVTIASSINGVHLSWMDVDGASSYKVFGAADPYAADPWPLLGTVATPGYTYNGTDGAKFFKVVADSNAPTRLVSVVSAPVNISNRPAVRAQIAPKSSLNRKLKK